MRSVTYCERDVTYRRDGSDAERDNETLGNNGPGATRPSQSSMVQLVPHLISGRSFASSILGGEKLFFFRPQGLRCASAADSQIFSCESHVKGCVIIGGLFFLRQSPSYFVGSTNRNLATLTMKVSYMSFF